jgi:hypothetical protein
MTPSERERFEEWWAKLAVPQLYGMNDAHGAAWLAWQAAASPQSVPGALSEAQVWMALTADMGRRKTHTMEQRIASITSDLNTALAASQATPQEPPREQGVDESFPVRPEHKDLNEVLVGAANLLDVIKTEWGEAWSEWDQSVRNGITRALLNKQPATRAKTEEPR